MLDNHVTRFAPKSDLLGKEGHYWRVEFSSTGPTQRSEIALFSVDRVEVTYELSISETEWKLRYASKVYPEKFSDIEELITRVETVAEEQVNGFDKFKGGILAQLCSILKKKY